MTEAYVTRDELRAEMAEHRREWAEFRADMMAFRADVQHRFDRLDTAMAQMELRLTRQLGWFAFLGGLAGGLIAAVARIFG